MDRRFRPGPDDIAAAAAAYDPGPLLDLGQSLLAVIDGHLITTDLSELDLSP